MIAQSDKQTTTIIIHKSSGSAAGIATFIFGLISIFFLAPLFVPLAILMGIIAIISRQIVWAIAGLLCAFVGFLTSPILMGIFGVATIATVLSNSNAHTAQSTAQYQARQAQYEARQLEIRRENFVVEADKLVSQMQNTKTRVDKLIQQLPDIEAKYHSITSQIRSYYEEAQALPGRQNSLFRGRLILAMGRGILASNQVNMRVRTVENGVRVGVIPLLREAASMKKDCPGVDQRIKNACKSIVGAAGPFKADSLVLAEGLEGLDKTYQTELAKQQSLITATREIP